MYFQTVQLLLHASIRLEPPTQTYATIHKANMGIDRKKRHSFKCSSYA